jgi:hypothetical protein
MPGFELPTYTGTTTLSPTAQQLLNAQQATQLGLAEASGGVLDQAKAALAQPFSLEGTPSDYNQQVADALYSRATRYLDPQFETGEDRLRTDLVNRGFSLGNEGYTKAFDEFQRGKERAYGAAREGAIAAGAQRGLEERRQSIQEQLLKRTQPLTELSSLMTGAAPQLPSFGTYPSGTAQPANITGATAAAGQYATDVYNADVAQQNALLGTLGALGSAGLAAWAAPSIAFF